VTEQAASGGVRTNSARSPPAELVNAGRRTPLLIFFALRQSSAAAADDTLMPLMLLLLLLCRELMERQSAVPCHSKIAAPPMTTDASIVQNYGYA